MHRLGRPVHAVAIALITTLSVACATDQPVPVAPDHAHSANDVRSVLARDIANVKWELASNAFSRDLDPGDAPHIEQRRDTVQAMLTKLEAERLDPIGLPASFDVVTDSVSPLCFLSGNLNGCFIFATINSANK